MNTKGADTPDHGNHIRIARRKKGLTQAQLALRIGHRHSYIAKIENGTQRGSFTTLYKIAKVLDLPPEFLLHKAGLAPLDFMSLDEISLDLETNQFSQLDPKVKRALLELAPIMEQYLVNRKEEK